MIIGGMCLLADGFWEANDDGHELRANELNPWLKLQV